MLIQRQMAQDLSVGRFYEAWMKIVGELVVVTLCWKRRGVQMCRLQAHWYDDDQPW